MGATFDPPVGRFIGLRIDGTLTAAELNSFRLNAATAMLAVPARVVFCSDLRRLAVLQNDVFDSLVQMLRTDNPKIERNGLLVSTGATVRMQVQRLAAESGHPGRRVFMAEHEVRAWLSEVLNQDERTALSAFLARGSTP